jgi:protein gp37
MGNPKYQLDGDPRTSGPGFGLALHDGQLDLPKHWAAPRMIFVNSMSDLFHNEVPLSFIADVFDVIRDTPRHTYQLLTKRSKRLAAVSDQLDWPMNLWMGVTVESSQYKFRIDHLRQTSAAVKFLSIEPLIGPVRELDLEDIGWVILGGESGGQARPLRREWAVDVRDECLSAGVPFFFKQWGGRTPKAGGRELDGRTWDDFPLSVLI